MIDNFAGPYRFLSNFWPVPIQFEGMTYRSVEHAFQAAKTTDRVSRLMLMAAPTPEVARRIGSKIELRSDWEACRNDVLAGLLRQKFSLEPFRTYLLQTGDLELVDRESPNELGELLMQLRSEMRDTSLAG